MFCICRIDLVLCKLSFGHRQKGKTSTSSPTAGNAVKGTVGTVSLKHVYEIAKIKHSETRLSGLSLEGIARSIVGQAGSLGVVVVP